MTKKRKTYEILGLILHYVKEKDVTYAEIERKLSTNPDSVREDCRILESAGLIKIKTEKHPANNRKSYKVSITEEGSKVVKNFEKKQ